MRTDLVYAAFSPDAARLALAGQTRTWIFDLATGQPVGQTLPHRGLGGQIDFSPDGRRVVTGSFGDKVARLWQVETGTQLGADMESRGPIRNVAFTPDGERVATWSDNGFVRLWDAHNGTPLTENLDAGEDSAISAFGPRSQRLLTHSSRAGQMTARVWDVDSGQPLTPELEFPFTGFAQQGRWLVSPGTVLVLLDLPAYGLPTPPWFLDLAEALVGLRFTAEGFIESVPGRERLTRTSQLPSHAEPDELDRWARWLVSAPADRSLSAFSPQSLDDYLQSLETADESPVVTTRTLAHVHLHTKLDLGAELRQVLRQYPLQPLALARLGRELGRVDQPQARAEAEWYTHRALELAPNSAPVACYRAEVLVATGRAAEALTVADTALGRHPRHAELWALRARALEELERWAEAATAYTTALGADPTADDLSGSARLAYHLGRAGLWQKSGAPNRAREDFLLATRIPPRAPGIEPELIDLTPHYNVGLTEGWVPALAGRLSESTNYIVKAGNDLSFLPEGRVVLDRIPFDVRGAIQLDGRLLNPLGGAPWPAQVEPIRVERPARRLHFLHAACAAFRGPFQTPIGSYRIHYADGTTAEIPLRLARELLETWQPTSQMIQALRNQPPEGANAPRYAAMGVNPTRHLFALFRTSWTNPKPGVPILTLSFLSAQTDAAPFLVAVTAESQTGYIRHLVELATPAAMTEALELDATEAALQIQARLRDAPIEPAPWVALGLLELAQSQPGRAEEAFSQALQRLESELVGPSPFRRVTLRHRAEARARLGQLDLAKRDRLEAYGIPPRQPGAAAAQLDLSLYYNGALTNSWMGTGGTGHINDLAALAPLGTKELGGVRFDVRGVVQLAGRRMPDGHDFPPRVDGIAVGATAQRLHFLHATGWGSQPRGTLIGHYQVHYAGGRTARIDLRVGDDLWDWWSYPQFPQATRNSEVVWTGSNEASRQFKAQLQLFKTTWPNPHPDLEIQTIDFVSALNAPAPFLVAITVE